MVYRQYGRKTAQRSALGTLARALGARLLPVCRCLALCILIVAPQRIGKLREAVAQGGVDVAGGNELRTHCLELGHRP